MITDPTLLYTLSNTLIGLGFIGLLAGTIRNTLLRRAYLTFWLGLIFLLIIAVGVAVIGGLYVFRFQ